ncbi:MAG: DUF58 domain-containing protein [Clostridia bacterium]|nr:DUF58 domain-containing protein [Clostridia bacterium]
MSREKKARKDRPRLTAAIPWLYGLLLFMAGIALSVENVFLYALTVMLALTLGLGALSVYWAGQTLRTEASLQRTQAQRGDTVPLTLRLMHRSPLPVGEMQLEMDTGAQNLTLTVQDPGRDSRYDAQVYAAHVGAYRPGLRCVTVADLFGLHLCKVPAEALGDELLVLPRLFPVEPLHYAPADPGLGTMARATEDLTDPMDVRSYQPGDPMKKIHWKLSARKREAVIRRFEEPVQPEALVLMNAAPPPTPFHRDTLLETAASILQVESAAGRSVRLPLYGSHPTELTERTGLPLILESLARAEMKETEHFEEVLTMETRRLRRAGAVAVLTCSLNGALVDTVARMRRVGPPIRLLLITADPEDPELLPYIGQLQQSAVEVGYVTVSRE